MKSSKIIWRIDNLITIIKWRELIKRSRSRWWRWMCFIRQGANNRRINILCIFMWIIVYLIKWISIFLSIIIFGIFIIIISIRYLIRRILLIRFIIVFLEEGLRIESKVELILDGRFGFEGKLFWKVTLFLDFFALEPCLRLYCRIYSLIILLLLKEGSLNGQVSGSPVWRCFKARWISALDIPQPRHLVVEAGE